MSTGFFAIGIVGGKHPENLGTLWRSAYVMGASFVFTVGRRYVRQATDTTSTPNNIPLLHFQDVDDLIEHLPWGAPLIGVEMSEQSTSLDKFVHPHKAAYLLGSEDNGLSPRVATRCHKLVCIESARNISLNVAVAGSIIAHHRLTQRGGQ